MYSSHHCFCWGLAYTYSSVCQYCDTAHYSFEPTFGINFVSNKFPRKFFLVLVSMMKKKSIQRPWLPKPKPKTHRSNGIGDDGWPERDRKMNKKSPRHDFVRDREDLGLHAELLVLADVDQQDPEIRLPVDSRSFNDRNVLSTQSKLGKSCCCKF